MIGLKEKMYDTGTYKKSWEALYKGKWYPVLSMNPPGKGTGVTNFYVLEGISTPIPQGLIKEVRWGEGETVPKTMFKFKQKAESKYTIVAAKDVLLQNIEGWEKEVIALEKALKEAKSQLELAYDQDDENITKAAEEDVEQVQKELKYTTERLHEAENMTLEEFLRSGD